MRTCLPAVMMALSACGGSGATVSAPPAWKLVWSDEFEGAAGTLPDPTKWALETGTGPNHDGWGNAELETYTARPDNVALDGEGHLVVTAQREALDGKSFTSGRLTTQGLFTATYGRIEARLKLPNAKGLWPAFWLLGANYATNPWPACGEIDVMELRGNVPSTAIGTLHGPEYFGGGAISKKFTLSQGTFDQDFHLFSVQWDPALITFSVDDQIYQTVAAQTLVQGSRTWVYDHPFFVILNLAVGGTFLGGSGQPDANTVFPQTMTVDWVRAYQRAP